MKLNNLVLVAATLGTALQPIRAGINRWTSLGPYGGAIKTLAIDPQNTSTMYAGTFTTVFKTTDGAASWMPASSGLPALPVTGLAIDPQNTSTLYAWSAGDKLFKSTDGAASWNAVSLPLPLQVWAVAVAPGGVIYVGGEAFNENQNYVSPPYPYGAVFKSLDSGLTWSIQRMPDHLRAQVVTIDPLSPNTVYVAGKAVCYSGDTCDSTNLYSGVLKTTDGGASWLEAGLGDSYVPNLVVDPATPDTLYTGAGLAGVYKSTDGGATWNAANSGIPDGFRHALALAIDPASPGTLYAVMSSDSTGGVFKSTDGGARWSEVNCGGARSSRHPNLRGQCIDPLSFNTVIDGDFAPLGVGLVVDPARPGTVYVGTNGDGVFKSADGGTNWTAANAGLTGQSTIQVAVDPQHPGTIYTAGWTRFFKSQDGGVTWSGGSWGAPVLFLDTFAIDPQNPNTIYAGVDGYSDGLSVNGSFKSTDGGMSWTGMRIPGSHLDGGCDIENLVVDPQNPGTVYATSYSCGLNKTTDQGETWNALAILPCLSGNPIAVDPLNSNTIYTSGCVTAPNGPSQVYKSLDGGMNWSLANSGLSDPVNVLLIDPKTPTTLYAGAFNNQTGSGIYKSTDGAASWKRIGPGSPLAIDPQNTNILYALIAGGVSRSTDGGGTWSNVSAGLPSPSAGLFLTVEPVHSNTVYAATNGGVFAITFAP